MKRLSQIFLTIVIVGFAAALLKPLTRWNRGKYRAQVLALYGELHVGSTRTDLQRLMQSGRYPDLTLDARDTQKWFAEAPYEFGAGNWVLVIEFDNGRVTALRIRTADSYEKPPPKAPPDRTLPTRELHSTP